jgi:hypothetical protein
VKSFSVFEYSMGIRTHYYPAAKRAYSLIVCAAFLRVNEEVRAKVGPINMFHNLGKPGFDTAAV